MVKSFHRPRDVAEALEILAQDPQSRVLSGGTYLLTGEFAKAELRLVSVSGILPSGIDKTGDRVEIGAGATFQDLVDSPDCPEVLRQAARGMADRNIRNRATVGGNLGANKSCASLLPVLLALEAELSLAGRASAEKVGIAEWLGRPDAAAKGLILKVGIRLEADRRAAYARYARTGCDLSLLAAAVSFRLDGAGIKGLRIAMGGLGPHARRFPELEALFEGASLPRREEIERLAAPLLSPLSDFRGSEAFKRLRASALLSEAFTAAGAAAGAFTAYPSISREAPL